MDKKKDGIIYQYQIKQSNKTHKTGLKNFIVDSRKFKALKEVYFIFIKMGNHKENITHKSFCIK